MVRYKWTQFNIQTLGAMFLASFREMASFATVSEKKLCPSEWRLLFWAKKYGHSLIIKRFASGLIADYNVHWNNNFFSVA